MYERLKLKKENYNFGSTKYKEATNKHTNASQSPWLRFSRSIMTVCNKKYYCEIRTERIVFENPNFTYTGDNILGIKATLKI